MGDNHSDDNNGNNNYYYHCYYNDNNNYYYYNDNINTIQPFSWAFEDRDIQKSAVLGTAHILIKVLTV